VVSSSLAPVPGVFSGGEGSDVFPELVKTPEPVPLAARTQASQLDHRLRIPLSPGHRRRPLHAKAHDVAARALDHS